MSKLLTGRHFGTIKLIPYRTNFLTNVKKKAPF